MIYKNDIIIETSNSILAKEVVTDIKKSFKDFRLILIGKELKKIAKGIPVLRIHNRKSFDKRICSAKNVFTYNTCDRKKEEAKFTNHKGINASSLTEKEISKLLDRVTAKNSIEVSFRDAREIMEKYLQTYDEKYIAMLDGSMKTTKAKFLKIVNNKGCGVREKKVGDFDYVIQIIKL